MQIGAQTYPFTNLNPATKEEQVLLYNKFPVTAFGDLRTAELTPLFQGSFEYTVDNTDLSDNVATAPATITQADGMAVVTTSTTTGRKAYLKSHVHGRYRAGQGGLTRFSALFTTGVASTSQWAGIFDEIGSTADFKNGYGIGYDGTTLSIVRFQNDVKFSVPRTSWNDKLDGTGASGMTIDTSKLNVFSIQYQYLGAGAINFLIEDDSTGNFVEFHRILYANLNTSPSCYNPNFHFYIYADNKATTSSLIVKSASYSYFVEGRADPCNIHQPQFSSGTITKSTVTTETALFTIKSNTTYASKANFISSIMELLSIGIEASATNNLGTVRIVRDATLGGTPSYTNINTNNSVVSIDTAGTTVTGGREIISYQLAGKNDRIAEKLLELKIVLQDGETFTVAVSSTNSATFTGSLLWKELF